MPLVKVSLFKGKSKEDGDRHNGPQRDQADGWHRDDVEDPGQHAVEPGADGHHDDIPGRDPEHFRFSEEDIDDVENDAPDDEPRQPAARPQRPLHR